MSSTNGITKQMKPYNAGDNATARDIQHMIDKLPSKLPSTGYLSISNMGIR